MRTLVANMFLHYLRLVARLQLAKIQLLQFIKGQKLTIIGITGSAGKSSTMLALEAALGSELRIKTNYGANSESGIPLNILGLTISNFSAINWLKIAIMVPVKLLTNWTTYQIYLVEMGIDSPLEPKNMGYLLKIIRPNIGIFLNAGSVHSQNFDSLIPHSTKLEARLARIISEIAKEKAKLITTLPTSGTAIINSDDPNVDTTTLHTPATRLTIGRQLDSTLQIISSQSGPDGFRCTFKYDNKDYCLSFSHQVLPEIFTVSFAAAFLAAASLELSPEKIIDNLQHRFHSPASRSNLFKGKNNSRIIDSSYNSSPQPTIEMLRLLENFPSPRVAVLGDMRELGQQSESAHQEVYAQAQKSADYIIGIGPETQKYFCKSTRPVPTQTYRYWWQALDFLQDYLSTHPNATLLVKGSQNTIFLEELIKPLLVEPSDTQLLCRQSPDWLAIKAKFYQQFAKVPQAAR